MNRVKRVAVGLVLILASSVLPVQVVHAEEPVYSDLNLPKLLDVQVNSNLLGPHTLQFKITLDNSYKVNSIKKIELRMFSPKKSVLEAPCFSLEQPFKFVQAFPNSNNANSSVEVRGTKYEIIFTFQKTENSLFCNGTYGLTGNSDSAITITDIAEHYIIYGLSGPTSPNPNNPFQTSNLWGTIIANPNKPLCRLQRKAFIEASFDTCNVSLDLIRTFSGAKFELTATAQAEAEAKAALRV